MKTLILCACLTVSCFQLQSQTISKQVLGTSGESLSNETHILNFTVGEPIVGMVQNGVAVHQGFWSELFSDGTLSVSTLTNEDAISIFPNPVVNYINFYFKQTVSTNYNVKLFDINGKQVLDATLQSQSQNVPLDISQLSDGMYVLTIESKETNYLKSFKIIKK
jgi:hypothetical protein